MAFAMPRLAVVEARIVPARTSPRHFLLNRCSQSKKPILQLLRAYNLNVLVCSYSISAAKDWNVRVPEPTADPLLIGVRDNLCHLIAQFNCTPT
jgi:hypothetical protein